MINWLRRKINKSTQSYLSENVFWCYSCCDITANNGDEKSCNITAYIYAAECSEAFSKMIEVAISMHPELQGANIYPEESYKVYCKETDQYFANKALDISTVGVVNIDWYE